MFASGKSCVPREKRRIVFLYEGRPVEAYEGESVAAALLAAGIHGLSRSFKYHRPRGVLCSERLVPYVRHARRRVARSAHVCHAGAAGHGRRA